MGSYHRGIRASILKLGFYLLSLCVSTSHLFWQKKKKKKRIEEKKGKKRRKEFCVKKKRGKR